MVESLASMPRTAVAALAVEGFLPALRHAGADARPWPRPTVSR